MDAKYAKQDVDEIAQQQTHLLKKQQQQLAQVLHASEHLFSGELGEWPNLELDLKLKVGAMPYQCQHPFCIPHAYLATLHHEVDRLVAQGVLQKSILQMLMNEDHGVHQVSYCQNLITQFAF